MCFFRKKRNEEILRQLRLIACIVDEKVEREIAHYETLRREIERLEDAKVATVEVLNKAKIEVPENIKFEEIPAFLKKVLVDPNEIHYVPTKGKKNSYTIFEVVPDED